MNQIYLHAWVYRDRPFKDCLDAVLWNGYNAIELCASHFASNTDYTGSVHELCRQASSQGVNIGALPLRGLDFTDGPVVLNDEIDRAIQTVELASKLSVPIVNCMLGYLPDASGDWSRAGSSIANHSHLAMAVEYCGKVAEHASNTGVVFSIETHMDFLHDSATASRSLIDTVGGTLIKATLDIANLAGYDHGESFQNAISILGSDIAYLHVKNMVRSSNITSYQCRLSDGDLDYTEILSNLVTLGFSGPICIEYSGNDDPDSVAASDISHLRSILSRL